MINPELINLDYLSRGLHDDISFFIFRADCRTVGAVVLLLCCCCVRIAPSGPARHARCSPPLPPVPVSPCPPTLPPLYAPSGRDPAGQSGFAPRLGAATSIFDHLLTISHAFTVPWHPLNRLSWGDLSPHLVHVCVWPSDADWCLRSDAMTDPRGPN